MPIDLGNLSGRKSGEIRGKGEGNTRREGSRSASTGGKGGGTVGTTTQGSADVARPATSGHMHGVTAFRSQEISQAQHERARRLTGTTAQDQETAEKAMIMAAAVERGKREERAREWEADVAWRSSLPARMERLAEAATLENVKEGEPIYSSLTSTVLDANG